MVQETIKVEQMDMKKASYPDILWSGGLGPCIAIGIYDSQTKSGYMMHEPHFQYADLVGMIQKIQQDYETLSRLKVFVAGNSWVPDNKDQEEEKEQKEFEQSDRKYVEQILGKYFDSSQIQIRWMPDNQIAELFLDTSTGKFSLEVQSLDDLIE